MKTKVRAWVLRGFFLCAVAVGSGMIHGAAWAQGRIVLEFGERSFSAQIQRAPFADVLRKIQQDLGIWIKGLSNVSDRPYSVEFQDMTIRGGLKRILSSVNFSLVFDERDKLVGIILLGNRERSGQRARPEPHPGRMPPRPHGRR